MSSFLRTTTRSALAAGIAGAALLASSTASAQEALFLVRSGTQQPLEDLNYFTPTADAEIEAAGGSVVTGDFDGDGRQESAAREEGSTVWRLTNGESIDDGLWFFEPDRTVFRVGDFDGDGFDEIAWRLAGCPFWVTNGTQKKLGIIFDGITGVFSHLTSLQDTRVGDFDGDGKDELAWRQVAWPGWILNDVDTPLGATFDNLGGFNPTQVLCEVGDFDGDGSDELAWRRCSSSAWNVDGAADEFFSLADALLEGFNCGSILSHSGDFDGDGTDEIAWRYAGSSSWYVNSILGDFEMDDLDTSFLTVPLISVVGDFRGQGKDAIAWRPTGSDYWRGATDGFPFIIEDGLDNFSADFPVHVGDFDGDGKDNIAWLDDLAEDLWQVDEFFNGEGDNLNNWQEPTEGMSIKVQFIYTDADQDGEFDDYAILVHNPDETAHVLYQPLGMAYFLKSMGMTITEEFYNSLSTEQQNALYENTQLSVELSSSFSQDGGGSTVFNDAEFNLNIDGINEMAFDAKYTAVTDTQQAGDATAQVKLVDFSSEGVFSNGQGGGEFSFTVSEISINYGAFSGQVEALSLDGEAYVTDGGFSIKGGATLVAIGGQVGDEEGTHVSAGVGIGVGGGVGAKWGENDQYGFEFDIKFVSFGVYVTGEDAETAFNDSKDWIVGAANDTADWAEGAWDDVGNYFSGAAQSFGEEAVQIYDDAKDLFVEGGELLGDGLDLFVQGFDEGVLANFPSGDDFQQVWEDIADSDAGQAVNTVIDTGGDIIDDGGDAIVEYGSKLKFW